MRERGKMGKAKEGGGGGREGGRRLPKESNLIWYCVHILHKLANLSVSDDLHVHGALGEQPVNGWQVGPKVVGVEHFELGDGLELVHMSFGHL